MIVLPGARPPLAERATDRHPARVVHKASFPVRVKPRVLSAGFGMVRRPIDYTQWTDFNTVQSAFEAITLPGDSRGVYLGIGPLHRNEESRVVAASVLKSSFPLP